MAKEEELTAKTKDLILLPLPLPLLLLLLLLSLSLWLWLSLSLLLLLLLLPDVISVTGIVTRTWDELKYTPEIGEHKEEN